MSIDRGSRGARSATRPAGKSGASSQRGGKTSNAGRGSFRGAQARAKGEDELAIQKAQQEARRNQTREPFRFRVGVGETTEFVVLDDEPDFHRFEHNLQDPKTGKWNIHTGCVKEWDNCPVCDSAGRESYYALFLTVIDFTAFQTSDGKTHEFSRKLLVVKPAQQKKFYRAFAKAEADGRTLRGMVFETTRDGEKDASIGNDIEFVEYMEEADLETYERSWKDKDNKKHTENCSEVYDYDELFPEPDADALRAIVGGEPTPGSRRHEERELGGRNSRSRGRGSEEPEQGEDDEPPARGRGTPARGASRGAAAPTRARGGRSRDYEDDAGEGDGEGADQDEGENEEYEAPERNTRMRDKGARTSGRKAEAPAPARGRGRGREEVDAEEDEPPFEPDARRGGSRTPARGSDRAPGTGRRSGRS